MNTGLNEIKVGLIVNPIAGMGGSVGLKGTDGVVEEAIKRGAISRAKERCISSLTEITKCENLCFYTCSKEMGENICIYLRLKHKVVYQYDEEMSSNKDTISACKAMLENNVDLVLFVGGDGTARDIYNGIKLNKPVIGIPAGVKIQSSVFARSPNKAGELLKAFLTSNKFFIREEEVLDIDEDAYRKGVITTKLYGYLKVPYDGKLLQCKKTGSPVSEKENQIQIASYIIDNMKKDEYYVIGPGSTTMAIMELLGLDNTLIGFDLVYRNKLILNDLTEKDIIEKCKTNKTKIVITPTGGQGYLLGRGNQQISPKVIMDVGIENFIFISTKQKLLDLNFRPLLVDLGDDKIDGMFRGYQKIITGYSEYTMYMVE